MLNKNEEKIPLFVSNEQPVSVQDHRITGTFMAISSAVLFAAHGTLIKWLHLDYLDATIVRCGLQVILFGLCLCLCGPFSGSLLGHQRTRSHNYFMIIFQVRKSS